jgi:hypothetical protein
VKRLLALAGAFLIVSASCIGSSALAQTAPAPAAVPAKPADGAASHEAAKSPAISSLSKTFFVVTDSPGDNSGSKSAVSIGVANEFRKAMNALTGPVPWILPEPSWEQKNLSDQCYDDPQALGGVIVTYYAGAASHFYLIYQEETLTFYITAQVVACDRSTNPTGAPVIVGVIGELPGAHGTPWVVRRSQVSIPLVSIAGLAAVASKGTVSSKTTDATSTAIVASLFTQASNRDIPGYSTPLKMRFSSQHIGVDLLRAMRDICAPARAPGAPPETQLLTELCTKLGFSANPAVDQAVLDAYEAKQRREQ